MTILDAALAWAARGFRVFPITPGDKVPPKGLAWKIEATTDPAKIRAWWAFEPNYNYAVAAGEGTLIVDVDAAENGFATAIGPTSASGDIMKYMGSKARHARSVIAAMAVRRDEVYVEPFVGGANLIADVPAADRRASDIDEDLICLWEAVSNGWMPPENFTEDEYKAIRSAPTSPLKGYAAFALSYGGKKFGGWCRDGQGVRDYVAEARRNAITQFPKLRGVRFRCSGYESLDIPDRAVVYCDPPYASTTGYAAGAFDSARFWAWARNLSGRCRVFVSEYTAPADFIPIWQTTVANSLTRNTGATRATEKLWTLAPEWN